MGQRTLSSTSSFLSSTSSSSMHICSDFFLAILIFICSADNTTMSSSRPADTYVQCCCLLVPLPKLDHLHPIKPMLPRNHTIRYIKSDQIAIPSSPRPFHICGNPRRPEGQKAGRPEGPKPPKAPKLAATLLSMRVAIALASGSGICTCAQEATVSLAPPFMPLITHMHTHVCAQEETGTMWSRTSVRNSKYSSRSSSWWYVHWHSGPAVPVSCIKCILACKDVPILLSYTAQIIHTTTSMHSSEASAIATSNLRPPTTMLTTDRPDRDRQMSTSFSSFAGISIKLLRQER